LATLTTDKTENDRLKTGETDETGKSVKRPKQAAKAPFNQDGFWKDLLDRFFYPLLKRALPELYSDADTETKPRFLNNEFQDVLNTADPKIHTSPHFSDFLLEVPLKDGRAEWVLLHAEAQSSPKGRNLAERMNHYRCLIYGHYRREPAALAIIAYRPLERERLHYSHCRYATEIIYRYNNLVLPDLDDDELMSSDSPTDLVLYAAKHAAQAREELQKYSYLRSSLELLGKRGWCREDKRDLLLFIERILYLHDERLKARYVEYRHQLSGEGKIVFIPMGEEKTAMEIKQRGIEEGMKEGLRKGLEKGKLEVARNMLASGIAPDIIAACSGLSQEKIRELMH
jgi:hypothetical protein